MKYSLTCPNCGEPFEIDEKGYAAIVKQVRDKEFEAELKQRQEAMISEKESAVKLAKSEAERKTQEILHEKETEIQTLKVKLEAGQENAEQAAELAKSEAEKIYEKQLAEKDSEIARLTEKEHAAELEKELAVSKAKSSAEAEVNKKENELSILKAQAEIAEAQNKAQIQELKNRYEGQLKDKEEMIEYYRDLKTKQSTKMIGETLEQHCEASFNQVRAIGFQNAYFEKDNEVSKSGSKGDFIFRDYDDEGTEFISIMFEMKNENETTATKHKNVDFLKELDKDRREKECEYAVLVTMLEADNDFYNTGIVDMSHKYPKMYVIRPQFFIQLITILRNAAINALQYRKELEMLRNQNIDITHFEEKLLDFKDKFGRNYTLASDKFQKAIDGIDKTIEQLQKVKDSLVSSENNLRLANNKLDDLTVKKLTRGNQTMKKMFADAAKIADSSFANNEKGEVNE